MQNILNDVKASEFFKEKCLKMIEKVVLYRSTLSLGKEENRVYLI